MDENLSLLHSVQTVSGPTQTPIQWLLEAEREADTQVMNSWIYTSTPS
jgi:hypothetical protein